MSEEKKDIMQIVIDIPEDVYKRTVFYREFRDLSDCVATIKALEKATPLPKGHGDLIDVNRKITVTVYDEQYEEWGEETLTVREALNRWSDEGITVKDVVILADKAESEEAEE